jgi:glycyl-tRNA synthetase beta chain
LLISEAGRNLLAAYKRAANILRIENAKDGRHVLPPTPDWSLFCQPEETSLARAIAAAQGAEGVMKHIIHAEDYGLAMREMAALRPAIDAFFENVTVNVADQPDLRHNRLRLLAQFTGAVNLVADFSKIEG